MFIIYTLSNYIVLMRTIEQIEKYQLVVVIRTETPEQAFEAARACISGGVKLVEITFSVPDAHEVIKNIVSTEGVTVGAGTVLSIVEARRALDAGASYIVSPHLDEEIVRFTTDAGVVSIPGACTPTEILRAHRAGADIVKLFPFVEMGGLKFLKTIRGPLPFIKYMPSGGVTIENFQEYLDASVSGIIVGSGIIRPELVKAGDWQGMKDLAEKFVQLVPAYGNA
jgi:2-dehydro-3-deoxyphosphogluconate aldolase/(4S)-4-hydroxy-2-oxoglutarate aldolase